MYLSTRSKLAARPVVESLEDRTLMSTCIVTRRSDGGGGMGLRGDLRYCINKMNAEPGADEIVIPVTGQINLTSPLPELIEDVVINGPGANLMEIRRDSGGDYRIFTAANGVIEIEGLTISNGASDVGGGIYNQTSLTLTDVTVSFNLSTSGVGGGIYNAGTLTVVNSQVSDNDARSANLGFGGGIYNVGSAQVMDSKIERNEAAAPCQGGPCFNQTAGGGVYNAVNADLSIDRSTISENRLHNGITPQLNTLFGVGVYNAGTASIQNSSIALNKTSAVNISPNGFGYGGGVHNAGPMMTIINSTIAANELHVEGFGGPGGATEGGGVFNAAGDLSIAHSTIAANILRCFGGGASKRAGGGLAIRGGTVHVRNSLIGNNGPSSSGCSSAFPAHDLFGALTSSNHNLFGKSSGGTGYDSSDILDVNPMLGPLQNNGGPTNTIALLPGSPAIDNGDNTDAPEFDQRGPGFPRIVNGTIDIGAFEVQSTGAPVGAPGSRTPYGNPLRESLFRVGMSSDGATTSGSLETEFLGLAFPNGVWERDADGVWERGTDSSISPLQGLRHHPTPHARELPWADIFSRVGVGIDSEIEL